MFRGGRQVFQVGQAPSGPTVIRPLASSSSCNVTANVRSDGRSFPRSNPDVCATDRQRRRRYSAADCRPLGNQTSLQIVQVSDRRLVHSILHHTPDLVVYRVEVWAVWRPQVWGDELRR